MLKTSFKQIVRTPVRTGLFILLLAAITTFLCFGLYMWFSAADSINQAEASFTTVGIIEYSEPQGATMAETDSDVIANSPYVELFDYRGFYAVYGNLGPSNRAERATEEAVIIFTPLQDGEEHNTIAVQEVLSISSVEIEQNCFLVHDGIPLQPNKKYIAAGRYDVESHVFHIEDSDYQPVEMLTEGSKDFLFSNAGRPWLELLTTMERSQHTLTALSTKDINTIYSFHQDESVLSRGRFFTQQEYDQEANVCLVSDAVAEHNKLGLGDSIDLTFYQPLGVNTGRNRGVTAFMSGFSQPLGEEKYEIVGIYRAPSEPGVARGDVDWYRLDNDVIIIPQNSTLPISGPGWIMNNLVSCRLVNGTADEFMADMEAEGIPGIGIKVYDQGYGKISGALASIRNTALILLSACLVAGLVVVTLFSYLFVGRQKRSIAIMYSLGAGRKRALGFIAVTVCIVAVISVSLGGLVGYILSDTVLTSAVTRLAGESGNFSSVLAPGGVESMIVNSGIFSPLIAAAILLVLTLILCIVFAVPVLKAEPMRVLTAKEE